MLGRCATVTFAQPFAVYCDTLCSFVQGQLQASQAQQLDCQKHVYLAGVLALSS